MRPPGFNEGEESFKTVEEMIRIYVEAIQRRQPKGPYAIAGYSLGCPVAFEIAKELEARGNEIAFLGCIDFWPCCRPMRLDVNMATALALVLDLIDIDQFVALNTKLQPELPDDEVCRFVLSFASHERLTELDLDLPKFGVWARVAHRMETLLFGHTTTGVLRAMTIFCGEGISPRYTTYQWSRRTWHEELRRWDEFVLQPRYIDVPGDHHSIIGPKHVAGFQAVLRSEVDLAFGNRGTRES